MQPITEQTARDLAAAIRDLTAAIKGGTIQQVPVSDPSYVARAVVGGPDAVIAENKRRRTAARKVKQ
jgi:hypothetical protein